MVETRPTYPERNVIVPQNHVWVEGDEAFHSRDSNSYGPVSSASDVTEDLGYQTASRGEG